MFLLPKPLLLAQDVLLGLTSTGGPEGGGTAFSIKSTGNDFTLQKTFSQPGVYPSENLCKGVDGNFYGMTMKGGMNDYGTIFKMTPSGTVTIIKSFQYYFDGSDPEGSLIQGKDGSLYGTASKGGKNSYGTIFKISASGTFTTLHHFDWVNGASPVGSLVQGTDGNFYGTTRDGGTNGGTGVIFKISSGGSFTVLRSLNYYTDGSNLYGNLVQGNDGKFYGMATSGGKDQYYGTLFSITPDGTFTVIRQFDPKTGVNPFGSLIKGADGNFYGMTYAGGTYGYGTIFKITTNGIYTVLRHLDSAFDGGEPRGDLVQGSDGNFYGTTISGGTNGFGTFFRITTGGVFKVLRHLDESTYSFSPGSSLVEKEAGIFFGMNTYGSTNRQGAIYKITSSGEYTLIAEFSLPSKGYRPSNNLIQAHDGTYYGMTIKGGAEDSGIIFKMCNNTYSVLKSLDFYITGYNPFGNLIEGTDGNLYGMTSHGGANGGGTVFKITAGGNLTVLRNLEEVNDGILPAGSLVQGSNGNYYGMTYLGGINKAGTIFKITSSGAFTVINNLDRATTGGNPQGSLIQGTDGNFYGMTSFGGKNDSGTIFKITPAGALTVLRHLNDTNDGRSPSGSLVQGTDGNFYGMTNFGGVNNVGTIFRITPRGTFTVLRHLNSYTDGDGSLGNLVQGSDGSLYGMAYRGGTNNAGTIFKITADGVFTVLRHLNKDTDGGNPRGGLIIQKADPMAQAQSVTTSAGTAKAITLTATAPGSLLTYTIVSNPKNGTLSGSGANRTYTPKAGFTGTDAFTFTATWGCQVSKVQTVSINVTGGTPITLAPVADAYVRNGTYAATNYGSAPSVFVKGTTGSGYARTSYLKFSLGNVTSVSSAKLRVYGNNTENTTAINLSAYGVSNDAWTETGITWNNAPLASGAALSTVSVSNQAQYYELDVTSFVQAQVAGDKVVSFLLKDAANKNLNLGFNSKEHTANPPQLVIQTAPALSTIRLNSGGNALTTSLGSFNADAYFSGNTNLTTTTSAIAGTTEDALYQDTRKAVVSGGSFAYQVPVSNGTYTVKLHFAELAFISAGKRQFNVTAEGTAWLTNYDIYEAAGGAKKAVVSSKIITVSDGVLNLNFISVVDKASIAAIEILPNTTGARLAVNLKEEASSNQQVNLFPNPATDKLTVKLAQPAKQVTILITDLTGVVHSRNKHQKVNGATLEIPLSALHPSIYLLHLTTEHGRQTLKFVKQ